MYDLSDLIDDPAWQVMRAMDINDKGQIAAQALHNGVEKAVLISLGSCKPPEPPFPQ